MSSLTPSVLTQLKKAFPGIVTLDVSMSESSHWRIGGRLAALVSPRSVEEVIQVRRWINDYSLPELVLGNTTNLLFSDENINAIAIKISSSLTNIEVNGSTITAEAGVYVPCLARKAMQYGLTGLEHTCGIPGTLGGLVVMNGGSQRKGIGESITYVKTVTKTGEVKIYEPEDCGFSYRTSVFQGNNDCIVEVGLRLNGVEEKSLLHREMLKILRSRSGKFPRKQPNCGSVFVSNPAMYEEYGAPGKIIEGCGLKGLQKGGAQISPVHANFIVNVGGATSRDVLYLIEVIRERVYRETGYLMEVEAKFVGADAKVRGV